MGLSILDHRARSSPGFGKSRVRIRITAMVESIFTNSSHKKFDEDCSQQEKDFEPLLGTFVENDNCHT